MRNVDYLQKPHVVQAIQVTIPTNVTVMDQTVVANIGDWIVTSGDYQMVMNNTDFLNCYTPRGNTPF